MRLSVLLREILTEQEPPAQDNPDTIEFPSLNFVVTVDRQQKKLVFAPQGHSSVPNKLRTMLVMLKQRFNVLRVVSLEDKAAIQPGEAADEEITDDSDLRGVFAVELDPREKLDKVIEFLRAEAEKEQR